MQTVRLLQLCTVARSMLIKMVDCCSFNILIKYYLVGAKLISTYMPVLLILDPGPCLFLQVASIGAGHCCVIMCGVFECIH